MLFLVNSRLCPGVTRAQVVEYFKSGVEQKTWELIKQGVIAHWYFKIGDPPGVLAVLNCESLEEARAVADQAPAVKRGFLAFEIEPVDHFPSFNG